MESEDKKELLLQQWQTCVEMANNLSQRRDTSNSIFATINIALCTAISLNFELKSIMLLCCGIGICILWIFNINNYKLLSSEKYRIINEIEKSLPYQTFTKEWRALKENKKYKEQTNLERIMPIMFILMYFVVFIILMII